ncbi:MAG: YcxB family protein [Calditrichaeota bacterium]|nr:YcxB family protein [Calditrichota bacterium]
MLVQNTLDDYISYLSEYALQNRTNKILMYTGLGILFVVILTIMMSNYHLKNSHIFFAVIGVFIYFVPRFHFYNDRRRLKTASYLEDVLDLHEITLNENHILFKKGDDIFETRKRDIHQFYELNHFYVISINQLHHFPIPKSRLSQQEKQFIRTYFGID